MTDLCYRGHYDIIYKDDPTSQHNEPPLRVMLATDMPQYVSTPAPRNGEFRSTNPEVLNEISYMFPDATQTFSDTSMGLSNNQTFPPVYHHEQPVMYTQGEIQQSSYFPEVPHGVYHAAVPQHRPHPLRTRSLPYPDYPSSINHLQTRESPSPLSPQPYSPATPKSVKTPKSRPKSNEPQIRYNENCFNYTILKNKSIPLDPAAYGR